jgi:EAL domain-containing protein (putative c-di-GMP-specific phosphodiesterase class I)
MIRDDLPAAVTGGQLVVHYQPIVRLPGDVVVGSEALVRWRHPELGLLSPDEFIPFAEDMGIIQEIDRYVMRRALRDFAEGHTPGDEVSVNLSPVSIRSSLPEVIDSDLREARVRPDALVLELTERVRLDRDPNVLEILRGVAATGARLAIDDFGAGTTSLAHLRNLPVNRLKLDRSLINDLTGPDGDRAAMVVRTLTDLAGHLGIEVLAEGVEEEAQRDVLVDAGIQLAQGYFFGRPGPLHQA